MKLYLRLIFALLSCMAAGTQDEQVLESRDSIIAKIESSKPDALEGWVQLPCVGSYNAAVTQTKLDANQDHLVAIVSSVGCDHFSVMVFKKVNDRATGYRFEDGVKFFSAYSSSLPKVE